MLQSFGQKIVKLRQEKHFSQVELSRAAGVHVATLNHLEHGTRSGEKVAVAIAKRLARTLGVSLDYLVGMYDDDTHGGPTHD